MNIYGCNGGVVTGIKYPLQREDLATYAHNQQISTWILTDADLAPGTPIPDATTLKTYAQRDAVQFIYAHIEELPESTHDDATPPGILQSSAQQLAYRITLRAGEDADSQQLPVSMAWRITLLSTTGELSRKVDFVNGVGNLTIAADIEEGRYRVAEETFDLITMGEQSYQAVIVGDSRFVVYRNGIEA